MRYRQGAMSLNHCNEPMRWLSNYSFVLCYHALLTSSPFVHPGQLQRYPANQTNLKYNYIGTWYHYPSKEFWNPVQTHVTAGPV